MQLCFSKRYFRFAATFLLILVLIVVAGGACLKNYYSIPGDVFLERVVKTSASWVLEYVYSSDLDDTRQIADSYRIVNDCDGTRSNAEDIPFVYEQTSHIKLTRVRQIFESENAQSSSNGEFEQMLQMFNWVGRLWDHGIDIPPGGYELIDPVAVLGGARRGGSYWCEVAAKFTVYAAASMGWPARLVTLSRDGYHWEHAVAEVWSNEYNKWLVVDTDYNVMYWHNDQPLSVFELCHYGLKLQQRGELRVGSIAPKKESIKMIDLLPYYAYVHIDLRNDWLSRDLPKGSPASGDISTWWTARPHIGSLFTVMTRVDDQRRFDWPVNNVTLSLCDEPQSRRDDYVKVSLSTYSPDFSHFKWSYVDGEWFDSVEAQLKVPLASGKAKLKVRVMTKSGWLGPISRLILPSSGFLSSERARRN